MVLLGTGLSIVLVGGFFVLTTYEQRRGTRVFAEYRMRLDAFVTRVLFITTHVDFEAFLRETLRIVGARIVHDLAHIMLLLVRAAERLLTRLVRHLRARHEISPVAADPRPFVRAMSDFKQQLSSARPTFRELQ